jgi:hypothetical protein
MVKITALLSWQSTMASGVACSWVSISDSLSEAIDKPPPRYFDGSATLMEDPNIVLRRSRLLLPRNHAQSADPNHNQSGDEEDEGQHETNPQKDEDSAQHSHRIPPV